MSALRDHIASGATTLCRAWLIRRKDGRVLGFTDHDLPLSFGGVTYQAETSLAGQAVTQVTGLAVNNSEAVGALSSEAISAADLAAGRYDGAEVEIWRVNWADVAARELEFRGTLGEVSHSGLAFRAELRGLTEALNQPQGRVFQRDCSAVLGDQHCRFNLLAEGYHVIRPLETHEGGRVFRFAGFTDPEPRWFERGRLTVLSGAAAGLSGAIKIDRLREGGREVELWEGLRADLAAGDLLRLDAGCDRRAETCRVKFHNFVNFRGFPHLPSEDWLVAVPRGRRT